jgi:hypothetical protein
LNTFASPTAVITKKQEKIQVSLRRRDNEMRLFRPGLVLAWVELHGGDAPGPAVAVDLDGVDQADAGLGEDGHIASEDHLPQQLNRHGHRALICDFADNHGANKSVVTDP